MMFVSLTCLNEWLYFARKITLFVVMNVDSRSSDAASISG